METELYNIFHPRDILRARAVLRYVHFEKKKKKKWYGLYSFHHNDINNILRNKIFLDQLRLKISCTTHSKISSPAQKKKKSFIKTKLQNLLQPHSINTLFATLNINNTFSNI